LLFIKIIPFKNKVGAGLLPAQFAFGAAAALAVVVQPKAMLVLS